MYHKIVLFGNIWLHLFSINTNLHALPNFLYRGRLRDESKEQLRRRLTSRSYDQNECVTSLNLIFIHNMVFGDCSQADGDDIFSVCDSS